METSLDKIKEEMINKVIDKLYNIRYMRGKSSYMAKISFQIL